MLLIGSLVKSPRRSICDPQPLITFAVVQPEMPQSPGDKTPSLHVLPSALQPRSADRGLQPEVCDSILGLGSRRFRGVLYVGRQ